MVKQTQTMPKKIGRIPFFDVSVPAGFPSPAGDYEELELNLNDYLIRNPEATFFIRVMGDSMIDAGIYEGDLLVVDRAENPKPGDIVLAIVFGEFSVKRLIKEGDRFFLKAENPKYPLLEITTEMKFEVWGVIIHAIHHTK